MKVSDIMTSKPFFCRRETDLGTAAELLWNGNCGFLPVVEDGGRVVGAVTDRDLCIALGTKNRVAGEIRVGEIASKAPVTCAPGDDIRQALATMADRKIHRLVVVGAKGELVGVLSVDDMIAKESGARLAGELSPVELLGSLRGIVSHQVHAAQPQAA